MKEVLSENYITVYYYIIVTIMPVRSHIISAVRCIIFV